MSFKNLQGVLPCLLRVNISLLGRRIHAINAVCLHNSEGLNG